MGRADWQRAARSACRRRSDGARIRGRCAGLVRAGPPVRPPRPGCSPAQPGAVTAIPGAVFSGSMDGHIRAFSTVDGKLLWDFDTVRTYQTVNGVPANGRLARRRRAGRRRRHGVRELGVSAIRRHAGQRAAGVRRRGALRHMRVVLFGATGMIGGGALIECLADDRVTAVQAISRSPTGPCLIPKLTGAPAPGLLQPAVPSRIGSRGCDACFYCLGVTAVGLDEARGLPGRRTTSRWSRRGVYLAANPSGTVLLHLRRRSGLHGARPDDVGPRQGPARRTRLLAARVLPGLILLRPGFIQPVKGVRFEDRVVRGVLYGRRPRCRR